MTRSGITLYLFVLLILLAGCEKAKDDYLLKFYGDAYEDIGYSISVLSDGYLIAGQLHNIVRSNGLIDNDLSTKDLGVIKTDWNGKVVWKSSTGGKFSDRGNRFVILNDGSVVCAGTFTDTTTTLPQSTDIFVVKFSASGDIVWEKKYGGANNQTGTDIIKTSSGFLVAGTTDTEKPPSPGTAGNLAGKTNVLILALSETGDSLNANDFGFPYNDTPVGIKDFPDGGYVILASTDQSDPGMSKSNIMFIRVNSDLNSFDPKIFGNDLDEYASDFEVTDGGFMVAGTIGKETDLQHQMGFVRKIKSNFNSIQDPFTPFEINSASTSLKSISKYPGGGFVIGGQSGPPSSCDMLVFRTDDSGSPVAGSEFFSGGVGLQTVFDVTASDDGFIIATGRNSFDSNSLMTLLKFRY